MARTRVGFSRQEPITSLSSRSMPERSCGGLHGMSEWQGTGVQRWLW